MQIGATGPVRAEAASAALHPEPCYQSDPNATQHRVVELERYLTHTILNETSFVCPRQEQCKASHRGVFYEAQLHHVGRHYDLRLNGRPLRIVVVGQEYGHNPVHVDLAQRYKMVVEDSGHARRFKKTGQHRPRNPHMRGTTSLLRLLFRRGLGIEHEREFVHLGDERVHIFDMFALVNFLLCSAMSARSSEPLKNMDMQQFVGAGRGRSTTTMQRNCAPHFKRAIEILDPTCVIAQGVKVRRWIGKAFQLPRPSGSLLEQLPVNGRDAILLSFTQPSAHFPDNWGANERTPYLLNIVAPAVDSALDLHGIRPPSSS